MTLDEIKTAPSHAVLRLDGENYGYVLSLHASGYEAMAECDRRGDAIRRAKRDAIAGLMLDWVAARPGWVVGQRVRR